MELRKRSRSKKKSEALKGKLMSFCPVCPKLSSFSLSPKGPAPWSLRMLGAETYPQETKPLEGLLGRRSDTVFFPDSMLGKKLIGAEMGIGWQGCVGCSGPVMPGLRGGTSRSNCR